MNIKKRLQLFRAALNPSLSGDALVYNASARHWEGHENSRRRGQRTIRLVSNDTDLNFGTREGIMSEARDLCQKFPICNSFLDKFASYCVHPQLKVQYFTDDDEWNEAAERNWQTFVANADFQGNHTLTAMARLAVKSMKRDGDVFFIKTIDNGFPKLQAVEADRNRGRADAAGFVDRRHDLLGPHPQRLDDRPQERAVGLVGEHPVDV